MAHRHRVQVTGALYQPRTFSTKVFRRCVRCERQDAVEVEGMWPGCLGRYDQERFGLMSNEVERAKFDGI